MAAPSNFPQFNNVATPTLLVVLIAGVVGGRTPRSGRSSAIVVGIVGFSLTQLVAAFLNDQISSGYLREMMGLAFLPGCS